MKNAQYTPTMFVEITRFGFELRNNNGEIVETSEPANKGKLHRLLSSQGYKPSEQVADQWEMKNANAKALGEIKSVKKAKASSENGKLGGRPVKWEKAPKRGCRNPKAELYRFTIVRLDDKAERFTNRKPAHRDDQMIWDNKNNCEA